MDRTPDGRARSNGGDVYGIHNWHDGPARRGLLIGLRACSWICGQAFLFSSNYVILQHHHPLPPFFSPRISRGPPAPVLRDEIGIQ